MHKNVIGTYNSSNSEADKQENGNSISVIFHKIVITYFTCILKKHLSD